MPLNTVFLMNVFLLSLNHIDFYAPVLTEQKRRIEVSGVNPMETSFLVYFTAFVTIRNIRVFVSLNLII